MESAVRKRRRTRLGDRKSISKSVSADTLDGVATTLPLNAYLTPRERDVAMWVVRGIGNVEIALALNLSRFTVRDHISQMLRKFGAPGRKELVPLLRLALLQDRTPHRRRNRVKNAEASAD